MTTVPTDPVKFKVWADRACSPHWPAELQILAYNVWMELRDGKTDLFDKNRKVFEILWNEGST